MNAILTLSKNIGWQALLIAMMGDLLFSFILIPFYGDYNWRTMAISVLGNPNSPVRIPFNVWMLIEGVLILIAIPVIYHTYAKTAKKLIFVSTFFITVYAIGACIFTCFFSVNETKAVTTAASIVHGFGSVIGFMLLLAVPLLLAFVLWKQSNHLGGIVCAVSFVLAFAFFTLFVMSDKEAFQKTMIAQEGLWQRLNLLFMYIPLAYIAINNLFKNSKS